MYRHFFKRFFDFIIALTALIIVTPILIIVSIWLHFANKGDGAFFFQERPGKNGKVFKIYKFKTMNDMTGPDGKLLPIKERITPVGAIVRKASLDELPQLINVVKGDMSLIGPRPLLTWYLPLYSEEQARRHNVRPGITGWSQVNGRNNMKFSERFKLDVWYVDHLSFLLDLKIIFMTVRNVFAAKDIGNGNVEEIEDLGWTEKEEWAEAEFERRYRK